MKTSLSLLILSVTLLFAFTCAMAQMLPPKHPGYPMDAATDPVTGQSLANDPGQSNQFGLQAQSKAARSHDSASMQNLMPNTNDARILKKPGAGVLPKVQGPDIKIDPPVKEAIRMK